MKLLTSDEYGMMTNERLERVSEARPVSCIVRGSRGFTLIELILVLALLVVIAAMTIPRMTGFIQGRALDAEAVGD